MRRFLLFIARNAGSRHLEELWSWPPEPIACQLGPGFRALPKRGPAAGDHITAFLKVEFFAELESCGGVEIYCWAKHVSLDLHIPPPAPPTMAARSFLAISLSALALCLLLLVPSVSAAAALPKESEEKLAAELVPNALRSDYGLIRRVLREHDYNLSPKELKNVQSKIAQLLHAKRDVLAEVLADP
ncbi:uncharacterized protein VTP21DRAFT_4879 [Calcarisporiella thermophila]|uniref:uncharacterized protein n=1 Tax=Calcarisporiella thermophila TaxID=911321 RepID=UPI003742790B